MKKFVLLTRPEGENESLASKLASSGWSVVIKPMLKIESFHSKIELLSNLDVFDEIIFVSKNSVRQAMPLINENSLGRSYKKTWLAIGRGTAGELTKYGISAEFPSDSDTESLLDLEVLKNVRSHRVLIIRGEGGRNLLEKTLVQRGAYVSLSEVYRRKALSYSDLDTLPCSSVLTSTSLDALNSLLSSLPDSRKAFNLVVPSKRIETVAKNLGFKRVTNSGGASDKELYDAIMSFSGLSSDARKSLLKK